MSLTSYETPREVATRYGVNQSKVLGWIRAGQLRAVNVANNPNGARPRWRISPEAITDFELIRSAVAKSPTVRRRRQRLPAGFVERY